ncbi:MAG: hypothetical protein ABIH53_01000 [archaeon]
MEMKKLLIGLVTGATLGAGVFSYFQEPEMVYRYKYITKVEREECPKVVGRSVPAVKEDVPEVGRSFERINLTDDNLRAYGNQLYDEMFQGDCVDMGKFNSVVDQIGGIYQEYGFGMSMVLYHSFVGRLDGYLNVCGFGRMYRGDLEMAAGSQFSLEDFWELAMPEIYDGRGFPEKTENSNALMDYLAAQPIEKRQEDIFSLCEDKKHVFSDLDTREYDWLHQKKALCRNIMLAFSKDFLSSVSWASEFPELAIAYENVDGLKKAERGVWDEAAGQVSLGDLEERMVFELAQLACSNYASSEGMPLQYWVALISGNVRLVTGTYYEQHILKKAEEICYR